MQATQLWQAVLEDMQARLSKSAFENSLRPTRLVDFDDDVATVSASNASAAAALQRKYAREVEELLSRFVGRRVRVEFKAPNGEAPVAPPLDRPAPVDSPDEAPPQTRPRAAAKANAPSGPIPGRTQLPLMEIAEHNLNPRYVYDHYVVGSSNRFAHAASVSVAEHPGGKYNPFFLYGGVGLGKTHLLHAIGHRAIELQPDLSVVYVSSEKFTNDVINAIMSQRMEEFRARYRTIDILMIDDIQFIGGKESTQEEFFHTFNALHQSGKQVVISSDKPPKAIVGLEERLRSRFQGGLIADVQLPDYEMRTAILRERGKELAVTIPPEVVEYVAQRDQSNIRELEGALNKVLAYAEMTRGPLSLTLAMEALTNSAPGARRGKVSVEDVVNEVARYFQVKLADLRGRSRSREIVVPRQVAMFLLREQTDASLAEIGDVLGGRDHTTVMHGIQKITQELQTDVGLRSQVTAIREALFTGSAA
jgi:chromosomal replication initiator protein